MTHHKEIHILDHFLLQTDIFLIKLKANIFNLYGEI
jgi:hypothetical protein